MLGMCTVSQAITSFTKQSIKSLQFKVDFFFKYKNVFGGREVFIPRLRLVAILRVWNDGYDKRVNPRPLHQCCLILAIWPTAVV